MLTIPGYQILSQIYESANSRVYRGYRQLDNRPAILKLLKKNGPTAEKFHQYQREYEILRSLNIDGAIAAWDLLNDRDSLVLVLEDFGGESLKLLTNGHPLKLEQFLRVAIAAAESLANLHAANIIHKDINPSNIAFNPITGWLKFIDFGISTQFSRESLTQNNPAVLEGTIAYMSPEQIGRMNCSVDFRTDLYALGVTFYELLAGKLPFDTANTMELIHCHLAKQPTPLHELNPEIPDIVSQIVQKLLAKTPEQRYQSARALQADLEKCLDLLLNNDQILSEFPLGCQDISGEFQIPQKLYGRQREIETLLAAFERVATNDPSRSPVEMMLVTGSAGLGKSALVEEIYQPIARQGGYFISGKFDQFQHSIPYSGIVRAFSTLVQQLLTEPESQLTRWREKLLKALGINAQVIIDVIPEVESIVGKQPQAVSLPPVESANRFTFVWHNFIQVFATKEHPLAIFLDNLQWVDLATLRLIERLMVDRRGWGFFLLIGAYRDNEVSPTHPLMATIEAIRQSGVVVNQICLKPLPIAAITPLLARSLNCDFPTVQSLADLLWRKTGGNPFFVNQLLMTFYEENLLVFNWEKQGWEWDIEAVEAIAIADNVVDLTSSKLQKLPEETQQVLRLAACLGDRFDLNTLSIVNRKFVTDVYQSLLPAIQSGLILAIPDRDKIGNKEWDFPLLIGNCQFLHNCVRQAAYALIKDDCKPVVYLQIGRLFRSYLSPVERKERLFEIVDFLNLGRQLIDSESEKIELARLNLEVGRKSKKVTAYSRALDYFLTGLDLLNSQSWERDYTLSFDLHKDSAELAYLNGNLKQSKILTARAIKFAKKAVDKVELYHIDLVRYANNSEFRKAVVSGRKALSLLGIDVPERSLKKNLNNALVQTRKRLKHQNIDGLLDVQETIIYEKKLAIKLLNNLLTPAYISQQIDLFFLLTVKIVNLSLDWGMTPESAYGFSCYGLLLGAKLDDYCQGYKLGQLAVKLSQRFGNLNDACKVYYILGNDLNNWVKPLREADVIFHEGYRAGLAFGEFQFAGYIRLYRLINHFYCGQKIKQIQAEVPECLRFLEIANTQVGIEIIEGLKLILLNLRGRKASHSNFQKEDDNLEHIPSGERGDKLCQYYILKTLVIYLHGDPKTAIAYSREAGLMIQSITGKFQVAEHNFYQSLSLAAVYLEASAAGKKQYWKKLESNQKQMKIWADNCPENFLHKYLLVAAEMARLGDRDSEAITLYDRAITSARENEFIQYTALANELAAKFCLSKGKHHYAGYFLREARVGYQAWGAKPKVEQLELAYPQFILKSSSSVLAPSEIDNTSDRKLDFTSIVKASQARTSEIQFEKFLKIMLTIIMENTGARLGSLILDNKGKLFVEAAISVDKNWQVLSEAIPLESSDFLPVSAINFVAITRENLLLNEAIKHPVFAKDPYIQRRRSQSLLCTQIVNRGKFIGLVYLENERIAGAFTSDRLSVLEFLCSQVAISIENARFYQRLQQSEARQREKSQQLEKSLQTLQQTQKKLVQIEKMSALGQLMAGVAHEINNPVNFITGNLKHAQISIESLLHILNLYQQKFPHPGPEIEQAIATLDLDYLKTDLSQLISSMQVGVDRIRNISTSLRTFSRSDTANKVKVNIHESIDSTLTILKHQIKANPKRPAIQIIKEYGELPLVECYVGQLNQVFMNILANAIESLEELSSGRSFAEIDAHPNIIRIQTEFNRDNDTVTIRIEDNGLGMSQRVVQQVFDHLFTTKSVGQGTGLGLSISYQIIVEKHGGTLNCISAPGEGAEFVIGLPVR